RCSLVCSSFCCMSFAMTLYLVYSLSLHDALPISSGPCALPLEPRDEPGPKLASLAFGGRGGLERVQAASEPRLPPGRLVGVDDTLPGGAVQGREGLLPAGCGQLDVTALQSQTTLPHGGTGGNLDRLATPPPALSLPCPLCGRSRVRQRTFTLYADQNRVHSTTLDGHDQPSVPSLYPARSTCASRILPIMAMG